MKKTVDGKSGGVVAKLNQRIGTGIDIKKFLKKTGGLTNKIRGASELTSAVLNPSSIPALAAGRLATTAPGATTLSTGANLTSKALENPEVIKVLSRLFPQIFTGQK